MLATTILANEVKDEQYTEDVFKNPKIRVTEQSEEVKEIVLSCILANRTVNETINIIDRRLGVKLAVDTIKHLRMKVRKEAFDELQIIKSDNDTYLYQFLKNVEQK